MKLLVAGIGNIFFSDDGFGPAVARALCGEHFPGVMIEDYGIRGMHLAFELVTGYDRAILIDAVPRGEQPGTLYVIEPDTTPRGIAPDAHRMDLANVFALIRMIGGVAPPLTLIGCEPATIEEGLGLSLPVQGALAPAVALVRRLITESIAQLRAPERSSQWTGV